jgi:hypothetical protein
MGRALKSRTQNIEISSLCDQQLKQAGGLPLPPPNWATRASLSYLSEIVMLLDLWNANVLLRPAIITSTTSILVTLLTLFGGWLVGQLITAKWNMRVKERELDLDAMRRVRELYGEFLSTWKLWNYHFSTAMNDPFLKRTPDERSLELLDRCSVR